jgi:hypothetical protein
MLDPKPERSSAVLIVLFGEGHDCPDQRTHADRRNGGS